MRECARARECIYVYPIELGSYNNQLSEVASILNKHDTEKI